MSRLEKLSVLPILNKGISGRVEILEMALKEAPRLKEISSYLFESDYLQAPASAHHHGAYEGALFAHSLEVAFLLEHYTVSLPLSWENPESPLIIGLLHDLCKVDSYEAILSSESPSAPCTYSYKPSILKGHGDRSVIRALSYMDLTEEEVMCVRYHMGAYEADEWEYLDRAIKKYPNVLYTHTADMHASKILGV